MLYVHEHTVLVQAGIALLSDDANADAKRASALGLLMVLVETDRWRLDEAAELQDALDACAEQR